jgi:hypothetical protein
VFARRARSAGFKGRKTQTQQYSAVDCEWCSKACRAFEKRSEDERNQKELKATIFGYPDKALLQKAEPAGTNGELVHEDDWKDDPEDGKVP